MPEVSGIVSLITLPEGNSVHVVLVANIENSDQCAL